MRNETISAKLRGVIPAMLTPMDDNEELSLDRTRALTRFLLEQGVHGLYLTGSTGEGFLLSAEERMAMVEAVLETVQGKIPVVVHVGAISTRSSAQLARHAAAHGASAISSVPPIYWNFSDREICGYYADLVQASGLPMIVYNVALAGLMRFEMIPTLAKIDGVAGIKYTATTHYDILRIKQQLGADFAVYSGCDEMAAGGMLMGADGLIGSTYNFLPDVFLRLYQACENHDMAQAHAWQDMANRVIFAMLKKDFFPSMKHVMRYLGVDVGVCRAPFGRMDAQYAAQLEEELRTIRRETTLPSLLLDSLAH